jgi:hypothetical protein
LTQNGSSAAETGDNGSDFSTRVKALKLQTSSNESHGPWVDPEYASAWTSYRRRRLVVFFLFFAAIFEIRFAVYVPGFFFALTFVAYFFIAAWLANWKCPRCGQAFFRAAFYRSILFGGRCFHCELPKWCVSETGDIIARPKFPFGWAITDQRSHLRCSQGQRKDLWRR